MPANAAGSNALEGSRPRPLSHIHVLRGTCTSLCNGRSYNPGLRLIPVGAALLANLQDRCEKVYSPMPTIADGIEDLLRHPAVWRVGDASVPPAEVLSSGFPALDARLPGGGWPRSAVTEILAASEGIGELELLAPALAGIAAQGGWIVCIAPPHVPYAPAFAIRGVDVSRLLVVRGDRGREDLWAAEQTLKSPACGAVLLWESAGRFSVKCLRRLQLAAETGGGFGVLFRDRQSRRGAVAGGLEAAPGAGSRGARRDGAQKPRRDPGRAGGDWRRLAR